MSTETLTVQVPTSLYSRLQRSAEESQRSVEDEVLDVLTAALSDNAGEFDTDEVVASLEKLNDVQLRQAALSRLSAEAAEELEALHFKRQRDGLSRSETDREAELVQQYERAVFVRSQALLFLKQRGHDIAALVQP